jgi:hypothetical protein
MKRGMPTTPRGYRTIVTRPRLGVLLITLAGGAWGAGVLAWLITRNWIWLVAGGIAGVACYAAGAVVIRRLTPEERAAAMNRWTRSLEAGAEAYGKAVSGGWSLRRDKDDRRED